MDEVLRIEIFHNTVRDYLVTAGLVVVMFVLLKIFRSIVVSRLKRWSGETPGELDDVIVSQIDRLAFPMVFGTALYTAVHYLSFSDSLRWIGRSAFIVIAAFYAARSFAAVLTFALRSYTQKHHPDMTGRSISGMSGFLSAAVWGISAVVMLDNLGFKVSAIVAGLGIGGIAVALAAQAILGDLFSYFVIFFDRPFQAGDFIIVDDKLGAVESIGIKTTRIRSLSGEELVFSNKDLTDSRVHNFKKMEQRRVLFTIGVTYQTPLTQIRTIPGLLKSIIDAEEHATFDRAHFSAFGSFSLNYEVVYYVTGADYNRYMDIQQNINLSICEAFAARNIEFAYPTQTVFHQPL